MSIRNAKLVFQFSLSIGGLSFISKNAGISSCKFHIYEDFT